VRCSAIASSSSNLATTASKRKAICLGVEALSEVPDFAMVSRSSFQPVRGGRPSSECACSISVCADGQSGIYHQFERTFWHQDYHTCLNRPPVDNGQPGYLEPAGLESMSQREDAFSTNFCTSRCNINP